MDHPPAPKKRKTPQCLICQRPGNLVLEPKTCSYHTVYTSIKTRASFKEAKYVNLWKTLQMSSPDDLISSETSWHRSCYTCTISKEKIDRSRIRFEKCLNSGNECTIAPQKGRPSLNTCGTLSINKEASSESKFLRSKAVPYNFKCCFFCQKIKNKENLITVRTDNSGLFLKKAVELSGRDDFLVRLNRAVSTEDAHAADVVYHKSCWTEHVFNKSKTFARQPQRKAASQVFSEIEMISLVDEHTAKMEKLSVEDVETIYLDIIGNDIKYHIPAYTRKWLKSIIQRELPHLLFMRPSQRNQSDIIYSPDAHIAKPSASAHFDETGMKELYRSAMNVRKDIQEYLSKKDFKFNPDVEHREEDVPSLLYRLLRLIIVGPTSDQKKVKEMSNIILSHASDIMNSFKSDRQVAYKSQSEELITFRTPATHENTKLTTLALTLHHETRSKKTIDLLSQHGYCIPYKRVLAVEASLANAVISNMKQNGVFIPKFVRKETHVYFAADNCDFAEDTYTGKGTTHGTIVVVYQEQNQNKPVGEQLQLNSSKSLKLDSFEIKYHECSKPNVAKAIRSQSMSDFKLQDGTSMALSNSNWLIARASSKEQKIPSWSGYNSAIAERCNITNFGALPLIPAPAHEWTTLLTVLKLAQGINAQTVGENKKTVISLDMALYEKALQLLDCRPYMREQYVIRLGELHVCMAVIRGIGTCMENSGLDDVWVETGLFSPATVRQILDFRFYKRSLHAHSSTLLALYELMFEEFLKRNPCHQGPCSNIVAKLESCINESQIDASKGNAELMTYIEQDLIGEMAKFLEMSSLNDMFKATLNYMEFVDILLEFIKGTRQSNWKLHMSSSHKLAKIFFSTDRLKYSRLPCRYASS